MEERVLELANEQVSNHLSSRDPHGDAESGQVERGAEHISQTEGQHGRNPALSQLERPASVLGHHVLLDGAAAEVVDGTGGVVFSLERASREGILVASKDVEVVIGLLFSRQE